MGRGDRAKVRWHNDRVNKKKARDKRQAATGRTAPAAPAEAPATGATAPTES